MKKRVLLGIVLALIVSAVLLPTSAFAKKATAFRHVGSTFTLSKTTPENGVAVTGNIVYRKWVVRHKKFKKIDVVQNGLVRLQVFKGSQLTGIGSWSTVDSTQTVKGHFAFRPNVSGDYRVWFKSTHSRKSCSHVLVVRDHAITLTNLHAESGALETSGDEFVVIAGDVNAPPSVITSETPAVAAFTFSNVFSGNPLLGPVAGLHFVTVINPGTVRFGFTVPATGIDDTMTVVGEVVTTADDTHVPAETSLSFIPSKLLP
jgi:hypothetical protein